MKIALEKLIELEKNTRDFGFEWPDQFMILDQVIDECREIREDIKAESDPQKIQEEIGDLLHAVISLCIFSKFDVEDTIEKINKKFSKRMEVLQLLTTQSGLKNLKGQNMEYMLSLWKEAKNIISESK